MDSHRFRVPAVTCVTKFRQNVAAVQSNSIAGSARSADSEQPSTNAIKSRPSTHDEKMRTHAEQCGLGLQRGNRVEEHLPPSRVS